MLDIDKTTLVKPKVSDLAVEQLHSSKNPEVKVAAGQLTTVALKKSCSHS
jgi:hypothetical protein